MGHPDRKATSRPPGQVIDFDAALLDACAPDVRADLILEARLLAGVFAPEGEAAALERMAAQLSAGERDCEMDRPHARRLAAALKHLAQEL